MVKTQDSSSTHIILPIEVDPSQAIAALEKRGIAAEVVPYSDNVSLKESSGISVSQEDLTATREVLAELGQSDFSQLKVVEFSVRTETVNWLGVGAFFILLALFGYLAWRLARFILSK
jgi:hypothetical protein